MRSSISGIVITKNEEKNVEKCLNSLAFCDEIIIIDDYSEDRTIEIAKKFTKKIYKRKLEKNFSLQRNFAISKATMDYVLFLDADEEISMRLKDEILEKIKYTNFNGFYFKRVDFIWGGEISHGEIKDLKLLRLARKNKASWIGNVHEKMLVDGEVGELKNPIYHYPHPTVSEFLSAVNFYSSIRAQELFDSNKKTNVFEIIAYPVGKFFQNFFIKEGYKDGEIGLVFAIMMSFHSFLVRGKLWQLNSES